MNNTNWFTLLNLLSHSEAIWYFADTIRNIGKTWSIKKYIWRRAFKKGYKSIYVRRFRAEAKEAINTFYASADIVAHCTGMEPYDPLTGKGNMKREGNVFFIKRKNKWEWFLKIISVTQYQNLRSADDIKCNRIFFDEYTTTPEKYKQYRGNEVEHFIDMSISICRHHPIKVIFCGNKENIYNPYYEYLKIPPLPTNFQGVKYFKNRTVAVQQWNEPVKAKQKNYLNKLDVLLRNTAYGRYMFEGDYKRNIKLKYYKTPAGADGYAQLDWNGKLLRITIANGYFYIDNKCDCTAKILTNNIENNSALYIQLLKKDRKLFTALLNAYSNNRIRYQSEKILYNAQPFLQWLNVS